MRRNEMRICIIASLGLLAPIWWTWIVSQLVYGLYKIGGAPDRPTAVFAWANILAPQCALGLIVGAAIIVLSREKPLFGWLIFLGSFAIGLAIWNLIFEGNIPEAFLNTFTSIGNMAFFVMSVLAPLGAFLVQRQANSPVDADATRPSP